MKLKMKVLAVAMCAIALCAALVGCSGGNSGDYDANFQGDWMLSGGSSDGQELDAEAISAMEQMGLYVYIQLEEGGNATISLFGSNMSGTWEAKDASTVALTIQGDTEDATLENGELVLAVDGDSLRFKKGDIPAAALSGQANSQDVAADEADSGE